MLECQADQINLSDLRIDSPFRIRRRGVELKLQPGNAPLEIDRTLAQNVFEARRWLTIIIEGRTFGDLAEAEGTSKRRIQDLVELALQAPEFLGAIASGKQAEGTTSNYLIKTCFPAIWSEHSEQLAKL